MFAEGSLFRWNPTPPFPPSAPFPCQARKLSARRWENNAGLLNPRSDAGGIKNHRNGGSSGADTSIKGGLPEGVVDGLE